MVCSGLLQLIRVSFDKDQRWDAALPQAILDLIAGLLHFQTLEFQDSGPGRAALSDADRATLGFVATLWGLPAEMRGQSLSLMRERPRGVK